MQIQGLRGTLSQWSQKDSAVQCVVVKGAGGKAYCAGGDVKWTIQEAKEGRTAGPDAMFDDEYKLDLQAVLLALMPCCTAGPDAMFDDEYKLDLQISRLNIPFVAILDGIVMGGGVGISVNGYFRVATERTLCAMPECGIGLYPDVGASHFLQCLTPPGGLGMYLALAGRKLKGVDVLHAGLATHYLPSSSLAQMEEMIHRLGEEGRANDLSVVNSSLRNGSVAAIFKSLEMDIGRAAAAGPEEGMPPDQLSFLKETLATLHKQSPLSLCVTLELLLRTERSSLAECLALDTMLVADRGDFIEGVRATLIDRTTPATWKYDTVNEVPQHVVNSFFEPLEKSVEHRSSKL
eukprot:gene6808-30780_t